MKVLIIGAGAFGATVAKELSYKKCETVVVDSDPARLESIRDDVGQVIVGNATDKDLLKKFAQNMDVAIVSLGEEIGASILIALNLKEIGIKKIIAKAIHPDHEKVLKIIGVHQVINPERDEAIRLAHNMANPNIIDLIPLKEEFNLVEVVVPEFFYKKTIRQLDVRGKYGLQVLVIKNPIHDQTWVSPDPDYEFQPDDVMIVIGDESSLMKVKD